jgi:hypothetical protein
MSKQLKKSGGAYSITDAREGHTDEMHQRMVKYSLSMGIRLVCFLLAFLVTGWLQWAFLLAAVFLPWFAVIIANGGSDQSKFEQSSALLTVVPLTELPASSSVPPAAPGADILAGEIVPDSDATSDDGDAGQRKAPPAA